MWFGMMDVQHNSSALEHGIMLLFIRASIFVRKDNRGSRCVETIPHLAMARARLMV
jgi:hypothetical protein